MKYKVLILASLLCLAVTVGAGGALGAQEGSGAQTRNDTFSLSPARTVQLSPNRAWLGVELTEVTEAKVKQLSLPGNYGAVVSRVVADSPAAKAGLKTNDVIVTFGGMRVWSAAQLTDLMGETPAGRTVSLGIIRNGKKLTLTVALGSRNGNSLTMGPNRFRFYMPAIRFPQNSFQFASVLGMGGKLGIQGETLTPQLAAYFEVTQGKGVLVEQVEAGSPAAKAGLQAGDCIVTLDSGAVNSLSDLRRALAGNNNKPVTLGIVRHGRQEALHVDLNSRWNPNPAQVAETDAARLERQVERLERQIPRLREQEQQDESCLLALESHLFKSGPKLAQKSGIVEGPNGVLVATGPGCAWTGEAELLSPAPLR